MSPSITRRTLLRGAAGTLAAVAAAPTTPVARAAFTSARGRTRVLLLGSQGGQARNALTGSRSRAGTAIAVIVDDVVYLVDAGPGALLRLGQAGIDPIRIRGIFVTHHHADHTADLGAIVSFAWTGDAANDGSRRLALHGPEGTTDAVEGLRRSYALNIAEQETGRDPTLTAFLQATEHAAGPYGVTQDIYADDRIAVTATRVSHGEMVPALGLRIRTPDADLAFSADRGPGVEDGFAAFAAGADVLFHEILAMRLVVAAAQMAGAPPEFISHTEDEHASPEFVGATATAAEVPRLVLHHLIPGTTLITDGMWERVVRPHYRGRIVVGRDLLPVA